MFKNIFDVLEKFGDTFKYFDRRFFPFSSKFGGMIDVMCCTDRQDFLAQDIKGNAHMFRQPRPYTRVLKKRSRDVRGRGSRLETVFARGRWTHNHPSVSSSPAG